MSAKQATSEVWGGPAKKKSKTLTINFPDDLGELYQFSGGETVIWQATDAFGPFTLQQGTGPSDIFNFPISSSTTSPYTAQATAGKAGEMRCTQQTAQSGRSQTSRTLTSGNVIIIVDTSTPGPTSNGGSRN